MDINEYKKIAIPKIEAGKMVDIVRKTIKKAEYSMQDQYEKQKDIYKPIVEKLEKEIDEISDLREEYVKSANKPIAYIQQQQQQALPDVEPKIVNLDASFTQGDKNILLKYKLPMPHELFTRSINDNDIVQSTLKESGKLNQSLNAKITNLSKTKKSKQTNAAKINEYKKI